MMYIEEDACGPGDGMMPLYTRMLTACTTGHTVLDTHRYCALQQMSVAEMWRYHNTVN